MRAALTIGALAGALALCAPATAETAEIASHRASYKLTLGAAHAGNDVAAITGAMFIEWREVCDGWTVSQRMRFQISTADGDRSDNDISFSSWEAKDGLSYRFTLRSLRDGDESETLRGRAALDGRGKGGKAVFAEPDGLEMALPAGTVFPTEHTLVLIRAAEAGETQLARTVFDGATQDGALDVNAILGPRLPPPGSEPRVTRQIGDRPAWSIRMAFFNPTAKSSAEPEYETSLKQQDNGVGRDYTFEYPDFSIKARLDALEALPKPDC